MKKCRFVIILLSILLLYLIVKFGFLAVFWFTTPKDGELRSNEKLLFKKIEKRFSTKDIWREPKYNISQPKDTTTYRIIINDIPCNKNVQINSSNIKWLKYEIDKLNLDQKFYKYQIIFDCKNAEIRKVSFLR